MRTRWLAVAVLVVAVLVGYAAGSRSIAAQEPVSVVHIGEKVTIKHGERSQLCLVQEIRGAFVKCDDRHEGEFGEISREVWLNLNVAVSVRKGQ
jgi:hypothetical protein